MSQLAVDITFHKKQDPLAVVPSLFITVGSYLSTLQMGLLFRNILLIKFTIKNPSTYAFKFEFLDLSFMVPRFFCILFLASTPNLLLIILVLVSLSRYSKSHQLGGFNNRHLFSTVLEGGSPRSECWWGGFLLSLSPWLVDVWLSPVSSHHLFMSVLISSSYKGISHIGWGSTLVT